MKLRTALVLAAGAGTRMRRSGDPVEIDSRQRAMADSGNKALMPFERPFLDYSLGALAEAGFRQVAIVVSPSQDELIAHCSRLQTDRLQIDLVQQELPRGTADAVLAAEPDLAGESEFAVLNGDTYYSVEALRALRALAGPGLVAFDRAGLLADGRINFDSDRMARFAVVQCDSKGLLTRILEKPDPQTYASLAEPVLVSLNCWRFSPSIFRACRSIEESERGEMELTAAVQYCIDHLNGSFQVSVSTAPVLDLSERGDIASVGGYLEGVEVDL